MRNNPDGMLPGGSPEDADRRAAQDAAGELARMGIDPGALGLTPASQPDHGAPGQPGYYGTEALGYSAAPDSGYPGAEAGRPGAGRIRGRASVPGVNPVTPEPYEERPAPSFQDAPRVYGIPTQVSAPPDGPGQVSAPPDQMSAPYDDSGSASVYGAAAPADPVYGSPAPADSAYSSAAPADSAYSSPAPADSAYSSAAPTSASPHSGTAAVQSGSAAEPSSAAPEPAEPSASNLGWSPDRSAWAGTWGWQPPAPRHSPGPSPVTGGEDAPGYGGTTAVEHSNDPFALEPPREYPAWASSAPVQVNAADFHRPAATEAPPGYDRPPGYDQPNAFDLPDAFEQPADAPTRSTPYGPDYESTMSVEDLIANDPTGSVLNAGASGPARYTSHVSDGSGDAGGSSLSRPLGARATPRPAGPPVDLDQLAQPLERAGDSYDIILPAQWRRAIRAVTFGLFRPGAAAAIEEERLLVARVRARRREPCLVGFIAGKGGVGTTTLTLGAALALATLRTDETTVVDARRGTSSLGRRLHGQPAPGVSELTEVHPDRPPVTPLRVRNTLGVVDGTPWHVPVASNQLMKVLEALRQENSFTLVDVGNDTSESGHAVLARADQVVIVTTASQDALESTRIALGRVRQVEPERLGTIVIAVACLNTRQHRHTTKRLRDQLGLPERRIVPIPFDPALASGGIFEPTHLRASTREAFLRVAGFVADPGQPEDSLLSLRSAVEEHTTYLPMANGAQGGAGRR